MGPLGTHSSIPNPWAEASHLATLEFSRVKIYKLPLEGKQAILDNGILYDIYKWLTFIVCLFYVSQ